MPQVWMTQKELELIIKMTQVNINYLDDRIELVYGGRPPELKLDFPTKIWEVVKIQDSKETLEQLEKLMKKFKKQNE